MNSIKLNTWNTLNKVKSTSPLIHSITNQVVTEFSANTLLAAGASPLMAHEPEELNEILNISSALVLNIGTLDQKQISAMHLAIEIANRNNMLIIIDPVGAGASSIRTQTALSLLSKSNNCILKANASEILSLNQTNNHTSKGVDSLASSNDAISSAQNLLKNYNLAVVIVTGVTDYVISEELVSKHNNGSPLMSKVTGMGCSLAGIIGAFCSVEKNLYQASQSAISYYGLCGEIAGDNCKGPGEFKQRFLDQLFSITELQIKTSLDATNEV